MYSWALAAGPFRADAYVRVDVLLVTDYVHLLTTAIAIIIRNDPAHRAVQISAVQKAHGDCDLLIGFSQNALHFPILYTPRPDRTALNISIIITEANSPSTIRRHTAPQVFIGYCFRR